MSDQTDGPLPDEDVLDHVSINIGTREHDPLDLSDESASLPATFDDGVDISDHPEPEKPESALVPDAPDED